MKSVVADFETYYAKGFTLSTMTTEAYVRDPRFETILCGLKIGRAEPYWVPGPEVGGELERLQLDGHAVIAHHAHFDGLILSHQYGIRPKLWIDTLSMARAVHGTKGGNSLDKLATRYGLGTKGDYVKQAFGKRFADFSPSQLRDYGSYCMNDCELEYNLAQRLGVHFVEDELRLIDATVRLFTEPLLQLRTDLLAAYLVHLKTKKASLLMEAGVQLCDVSSNERFADALRFMGIDPPMKLSNATGQPTYAFAKTDPMMQELAEHPDDAVQALVAARLNAKSTINETRAQRLIEMAARGSACVYVNYYGAGVSGRASGGDKLNWQNHQRVAYDKQKVMTHGQIRVAVEAPDGYELVVADSSNVESRVLDWLAGQDDMVEAYRLYDQGLGPDIYCVMGEKIFGRVITKENDPDERFVSKTAKLGLGYGMGAFKFEITLKPHARKNPVVAALQCAVIVSVYRQSHHRVEGLWKRCGEALGLIAAGVVGAKVDFRGVVTTCEDGLLLPNGLVIKYPDLRRDVEIVTKKGKRIKYEGWSYFDGRARQRIYGGKVCENIIQALARIIVLSQTLLVPRKLVLSVHDEGVWCVRTRDIFQTVFEAEWALRQPLPWCLDLPLNCEVGVHKSYGRAKK